MAVILSLVCLFYHTVGLQNANWYVLMVQTLVENGLIELFYKWCRPIAQLCCIGLYQFSFLRCFLWVQLCLMPC